MKPFSTLWTVVAASSLVLVATAPASAGNPASAVARSSIADADALVWSHLSVSPPTGYSILKASVAAPGLAAPVLSGSDKSSFSDPEVSPGGSKLAYIRGTYVEGTFGPTANLEVRDLATGNTTVLVSRTTTGLTEFQLDEPTWSPDGETIAYVATSITGSEGWPTVRSVAASGGPSRLVDGSSDAAAWRPDGRLTVARLPRDGAVDGLWVTGATPDEAVVIPGSTGARDHAWSPDGSQVVFSRSDSGAPPSIETLPKAGGTSTVLVPASNEWRSSPVWSSDGQRIYFTLSDASSGTSSRIMQVPRTGGTASTAVNGDYNVSASITTKVAAPVPSRFHDFNPDGYADVIARAANGDLRLYTGVAGGPLGSRLIGTGWDGMTAIFTPGDFDGDNHPDVIGRKPNGDLLLYTGVGGGPLGSRLIGTGFGGMTAVFSPGDFTGDGHPDVIARTTSGELRLYLGTGGALTGGAVIGTGWNAMTAVFSPGDFDADRHADVIGRTSSGDLRLYSGTGTKLTGSTVIGTGWNGLTALFSTGDFNLDGKPDVIGRMSNGDLRVYYGNGTRLSGWRVIGTRWDSVNPIL